MGSTSSPQQLPEFVLFGDSLTEWAFDERTRGFGLFLEGKYDGKVRILNEGQAGYTSVALKRDFDRIITRATSPSAPTTLLFTIFLGANDAVLFPSGEYVPLPTFDSKIREFVETILTQDAMDSTKIVLITPPPINVRPVDIEYTTESRAVRTYMSKKRYAERIMEIAGEYEETGRVVGLNYWKELVDAGLRDQGRNGDEDQYDEERLPGCGLKWADPFAKGYFTDGLHLNVKGYEILSNSLYELIVSKWPELAPEKIGK